MLTTIFLQNFKCFKEKTAFPLGRITLLTGINGRGKSSLIQSLLLFKQSLAINANQLHLYLNGEDVRLGTWEDLKNSDAPHSEPIEIGFEIPSFFLTHYGNSVKLNRIFYKLIADEENDICASILGDIQIEEFWNNGIDSQLTEDKISRTMHLTPRLIEYKGQKGNKLHSERLGHLKEIVPGNPKNPFIDIPFSTIHYISADRIGPKDYYPRANHGSFVSVGAKGEFTASVLAQKQNEVVHDKLYIGKDAQTVLQQTEEWLRFVFGEARLTVEMQKDIVYLFYNTKQTKHRYKPSNIGFGYSYILPIIVSGLIAKPGEILIVENPEAHLHPKAQSLLLRFLAIVAETGVQIIIESHSEHILNALRIVAIDKEIQMTNKEIQILYFHDKAGKPFTEIPINEDGGIEVWPDGFFDQSDKDYKTLFGF